VSNLIVSCRRHADVRSQLAGLKPWLVISMLTLGPHRAELSPWHTAGKAPVAALT